MPAAESRFRQGDRGRSADRGGPTDDAARKRAAVEIVARHEAALRRTARRYSLGADDAEDAYQRALEILLTKAPTTDLRELIRWTQTVTKHEALAVRDSRERLLGPRPPRAREGEDPDPVAQIPAPTDGPDEQVQRREAIARSREALRALKPAELRALSLLAEGYSYAEIGETTGFSPTKVNRVLSEGRQRYRDLISNSEDGTRCRELQPLLSAFCDGEASATEARVVREHLRACAHCRATMRTFRAVPRSAAALVPLLPLWRSLLDRAWELLSGLGSRLPGASGAKLAAGCVAVVGGAGLTTGHLPVPLEPSPDPGLSIERPVQPPATHRNGAAPSNRVRRLSGLSGQKTNTAERAPRRRRAPTTVEEVPTAEAVPAVETVEYEAPPPPAPAPQSEAEGTSSTPTGSPAGEFGP
ncbi:MAG TPA: sigma-70 family RNA polymerase sigma factor [Solirubrobacterales bacterium]|nr:sigma-70 family RNA polymerase sigma factor [Solirubrobacterales bacterium]